MNEKLLSIKSDNKEIIKTNLIKDGKYSIGSDKSCNIQLKGEGVSPVHCHIEIIHSDIWIKNSNVNTKTYVNCNSIDQKKLRLNDYVNIGNYCLKISKHKNSILKKNTKIGTLITVDNNGKSNGNEKISITTDSIIGRNENCRPRINKDSFSDIHFSFCLINKEPYLVDYNSLNGTIVDGNLIKGNKSILYNGSIIEVDNLKWRFDSLYAHPIENKNKQKKSLSSLTTSKKGKILIASAAFLILVILATLFPGNSVNENSSVNKKFQSNIDSLILENELNQAQILLENYLLSSEDKEWIKNIRENLNSAIYYFSNTEFLKILTKSNKKYPSSQKRKINNLVLKTLVNSNPQDTLVKYLSDSTYMNTSKPEAEKNDFAEEQFPIERDDYAETENTESLSTEQFNDPIISKKETKKKITKSRSLRKKTTKSVSKKLNNTTTYTKSENNRNYNKTVKPIPCSKAKRDEIRRLYLAAYRLKDYKSRSAIDSSKALCRKAIAICEDKSYSYTAKSYKLLIELSRK